MSPKVKHWVCLYSVGISKIDTNDNKFSNEQSIYIHLYYLRDNRLWVLICFIKMTDAKERYLCRETQFLDSAVHVPYV